VVFSEGIGLFLSGQEDCGTFRSIVRFVIVRGDFHATYGCGVSSVPNLERGFSIGFYRMEQGVSLGYLARSWASGQGKFVFGPVDFRVVEPQPISSQDEIVVSNIRDVELGTFLVSSS